MLIYAIFCATCYIASNKEVALKCLHNSQESIDSLINEAKKYPTTHKEFQVLFGLSQNPVTGDYIFVQSYTANWISGNEKIDDFIQERQLKINNYNDIVLEWIPYNQFNKIKETGKNNFITVYSAIWKDGPLYKYNWDKNYTRDSNKEVALKCLHNSQESIDSLINEAKKYPTTHNAFQVLFGISQNPDTGDYILVLKWTSGNEKIDDFIQERQLKINNYNDIVLEWIPYNQFNKIKETGKNNLITVYSAIWKDGPLYKKYHLDENYTRDSNKEVALKCLHNSRESIDSLINEAKKYPTTYKEFQVLFGISKNPDTGDYIFVQSYTINLANWISGNEKIDYFIQERQLKINNYNDIVLEWIPYNQFNEIKETGKNDLITVYLAIWKDGPLYKKSHWDENYTRDSNKEVALKCLHNSQESIDSLINKAKKYPTTHTTHNAFQVLYGISQNPDTGDYIFVQMLEWISYNQFNEIKETGKNDLITVYSAIWKDGLLYKKYHWNENYTRDSNKEVALKCLHNSQESIDSLINKAKKYPTTHTTHNAFQVLFGISQNPDTGDYIFVQMLEWISYNQFNEIKETGKNDLITVYSAIWKDGLLYKKYHWNENYTRDSNKEVALKCLHNSQESIDSLINKAKKYPTTHNAFQVLYGISQNPDTGDYILVLKWTSGNEKIDDFIQERQLKINNYNDIVLEWIPYNQFNEIKETGNNGLIGVYLAIWKDGPLHKYYESKNYTRDSNKEVALKCLHNSQESIDFLINEAKKYPTTHAAFQVLIGISQNPDTGDYIFVQMLEWIPYNQFNEIKETGNNGLIAVYSAIWKDGPLYKKYHWDENYTRDSNKEVALKCLHNSQESIDFLINEAKKYPTTHNAVQVLYGISQNPDTGDYILVLKWTSGNEKIDDFIQERQLKINNYNDIVLEWIPYNQFNEIKETGNNGLIGVYLAIWKDGPLHKYYESKNYTRDSNKEVALKCLHNSQESIDFLINEAKKYPTTHAAFQVLIGISQNPDTGDYIFVQMLEWIPYNQFNEIKETGNNGLIAVYSAIWKDGPLYKKYHWDENYTRDSNKEVALKCLHNSQESIDFLINEAKKYPTTHNAVQVLYGISQNPDTGDYILVIKQISGNEKIDYFIQEMQLKINNYDDIVFEWIPYSQFKNIKKVGKGGFSTVYLAKWKDGPLKYDADKKIYYRNPNRKIALKWLYNSQNITDKFLNEVKEYFTEMYQ
ncbi:uncharacterized protein OCT59_003395 [Rhizophagus irregularis]|uniref:uncharacterized protein n=1 Tax=Rhizophagus irregularis TaxID=588596 RepID=UPI00332EEF94|nr:hypothetical protein OCT59_003395 [Rhizophagus irregularis]